MFIFQTMKFVRSDKLCFKYGRFTPLDCEDM